MTTDDKVRDQNPKYDFNREAAKISVLSLGKIDKCEYFADEDILPMHQGRMMKQANFSYSLLGKSFEIQIKTIEDEKNQTNKGYKKQGKQPNFSGDKDSLILLKQKDICYELINERMVQMQNLVI